jgi:hypothetical protein
MAIGISKLQSLLSKGESEQFFLGKVESETKESFTLKKEQAGSPVGGANLTRKYLGSKGSKIVTYIDGKKGTVSGATTTAEGL